jgi:F420-non-reducing hydrogenase large subunit
MTTLTFPLSRIEGHARVVIEIHDGEVNMAHFQAMELRGFEYLVQGTPAEQMPVIVPRICGVCSTRRHAAAPGAQDPGVAVARSTHPKSGYLSVCLYHARSSGANQHI